MDYEKLLIWYGEVKRDLPWRRTSNPYFIWVSEVMLQQTQVKTVIPYYHRFIERFPDIKDLAQASLEEVYELWRGLGYYSRARRLWEGARYLVEAEEGKVPGDYLTLLKIPGVGEYTAGAIASIAFGECVPVLDGNVKRVVARFLAWEEVVESVKSRRFFMTHLKAWLPVKQAGDFNQAMMELGATVCTPKSPKCLECPIREECRGYHLGTPQAFPVKRSKEKIDEAIRPTLIIRRDGKVLLKKRPNEGLLANLWEFPGEEILMEGANRPKRSSKRFSDSLRNTKVRVAEVASGYNLSDTEELESFEAYYIVEGEYSEKTKKGFPWFNLYRNQVMDRSIDTFVKEQLKKEFTVSGPIVHTFSHRCWKIYWIVLDISGSDNLNELNGLRWVDEKEMNKIALPVAFQKIWASLET